MTKIEERWEEKMREVVKRGTQLLLEADPKRVLLMMDCTKENPLYSELYKQTKQLEKQLQNEIQPFYQIKECQVKGLGDGYAVLLTLGDNVSDCIGQFLQEDLMKGMLANCIADQLLFSMEERMQLELIQMAKEEGVGLAAGKEAPLDFRVEDVLAVMGKETPVTVTSGGMLKPEKSMLFFFEKTKDTACYQIGHDCKNCTKKNCNYAKK